MITALRLTVLLSLLLIPQSARALQGVLQWTQETDPSVTSYRVYICTIPGCVPTKGASGTTLAGTVPQPPSGTSPTFQLTRGWQGAAAVTAVNAIGESDLSNVVTVDLLAPGAATDFSNP